MQLNVKQEGLVALLKSRREKQRGSYTDMIMTVAHFLQYGKADQIIKEDGIEMFKLQFQLLLRSKKCKELAEFFNEIPPKEIKTLWVDGIHWMIGEYGTPH